MILPVYAQVDLTNGRWRKCTISARLFEQYLGGGKALGARLLTDLTTAGLDPLSPEAVLIVNTGSMNDTGAPSSSRFNMTFKNVLTGGIASSNCGGPFGMLLKKAGFDGLILCGKAPELSMVVVEDGKIRIEACPQLQGLDTERTQEELPERYGKLVIGPAGGERGALCLRRQRRAGGRALRRRGRHGQQEPESGHCLRHPGGGEGQSRGLRGPHPQVGQAAEKASHDGRQPAPVRLGGPGEQGQRLRRAAHPQFHPGAVRAL